MATTTTQTKIDSANARYSCNYDDLDKLRKESPWKNDPLWFSTVEISPTAIMKMVRLFIVPFLIVLWILLNSLHYLHHPPYI